LAFGKPGSGAAVELNKTRSKYRGDVAIPEVRTAVGVNQLKSAAGTFSGYCDLAYYSLVK